MADSKTQGKKLVYESQESLYKRAQATMRSVGMMVKHSFKIQTYLKAAEMFEETGEYEDAPELARECRRLAQETALQEKEYRYSLGVAQRDGAQGADGYEKAAAQFEAAGEYEDAPQQREACLQKARELQHHSRVVTRVVLGSIAAVILAGILFFHSALWKNLWNSLLSTHGGETAEKEVTLENAQPGDKLSFGAHEWYVLEREEGKLHLLLAHAEQFETLRHTPYHETAEPVTWEESSLRAWLNDDFLAEDFSTEERERILKKSYENPDNPEYGTGGGNETEDQVTLLLPEEVETYHDILSNIRMNIWLRMPGNSPDTAAFMASTNVAMLYGYPVSSTDFYTCPVIWIETE